MQRRGIGAALRACGTRLAGTIDCFWWPESVYDMGRRAVQALLGEPAPALAGVQRLPMPLRSRSSIAAPGGRG